MCRSVNAIHDDRIDISLIFIWFIARRDYGIDRVRTLFSIQRKVLFRSRFHSAFVDFLWQIFVPYENRPINRCNQLNHTQLYDNDSLTMSQMEWTFLMMMNAKRFSSMTSDFYVSLANKHMRIVSNFYMKLWRIRDTYVFIRNVPLMPAFNDVFFTFLTHSDAIDSNRCSVFFSIGCALPLKLSNYIMRKLFLLAFNRNLRKSFGNLLSIILDDIGESLVQSFEKWHPYSV